MGIVRWGPPEELLLGIRNRFGIDTFVETGTYEGRTAAWASGHFRRVLTVELSPIMFDRAVVGLSRLGNVESANEDSVSFLRGVVDELDRPAIFWLDAHWCGGAPTAGAPHSPCPLLGELAEINRSPRDNFILIDDARYFLMPPEPPYDPASWPTLWDVLSALHSGGQRRYSIVTDDVIVAVPLSARDMLIDYSRSLKQTYHP